MKETDKVKSLKQIRVFQQISADQIGGYETLEEACRAGESMDSNKDFKNMSMHERAKKCYGWNYTVCEQDGTDYTKDSGYTDASASGPSNDRESYEQAKQKEYADSAKNNAYHAMLSTATGDAKGTMLAIGLAFIDVGKYSASSIDERVRNNPDLERELNFVRDASNQNDNNSPGNCVIS